MEKFKYNSLDEIKNECAKIGVNLPFSQNTAVLNQKLQIKNIAANNRIAIQPMEGCDGTFDGKPDELTFRRYERFAKSGAGLIWVEACAVVNEGRANPRQLFINNNNLESFKKMTDMIKETSVKENGFAPVLICQLTHSGRYSKPQGVPAPLIAYNNPVFEKGNPIDSDRILSDDYFKNLEEKFAECAYLAERAGFDGADIKACHRYLLSETLSAFTRSGEYGGSFENRTKLLRNSIMGAVNNTSGNFIVTTRMNAFDGFDYPYGFGKINENGSEDFSEACELVKILNEQSGVELVDITIGNPYVNPHVNRPYESGGYITGEHQFQGVDRIMRAAKAVKQYNQSVKVISSGYSYLRQFSPNLAAGMIENNFADMAGFGRMAFAYPDFAKKALQNEPLEKNKCCITCSKCTELMRAGTVAGCVVRDSETYLPIYKEKCIK